VKYFCGKGWTENSQNDPSGKSIVVLLFYCSESSSPSRAMVGLGAAKASLRSAEVESHDPRCPPWPFVEARIGGAKVGANRLALDIGVPSGRITDILDGRRGITADTAVRLGRYFGNSAQSGSTCRGNMTSAWSSGRRAPRSPSASGRRMWREPAGDLCGSCLSSRRRIARPARPLRLIGWSRCWLSRQER
jgi:hypothetical protein